MKELEYTTQSVPKGKRFCTICGEVKRLHYFEGDSTHCSACCEKMLHTRLHRWCIPVLLAVLLVAAASVYLSVFTVPYCIDLVKAEFAMRDKRLDDACTVYASAVNSASERNAALQAFGKKNADGTYTMPDMTLFEAGTRTWTKYLQTYAALYSEYEAAALVQSSLNTDVANTVPFVASLNEAQEAYNNTLAQAQLIEAQYAEEESEQTLYEKVIADLTAYAKQSDSRYIKGYVEMYKARATAYFKPDAFESTKAYYEKMLEYLPDEFMAAYLAEAEAAQRAGNYEAAIEAYEKLLQKNHNYTQAYSAIAKAAFCAGNTEKVQQILDRYAQNDATRLQLEMAQRRSRGGRKGARARKQNDQGRCRQGFQ